jgi:hypothetical protein
VLKQNAYYVDEVDHHLEEQFYAFDIDFQKPQAHDETLSLHRGSSDIDFD